MLIDISLADLHFQLLADRGLFWPEQRTLFVADTHFGKDATFRAQGAPVPAGSTDGTLAKISKLLRQTGADRLCILGDMFHARSSLSSKVKMAMASFFGEHPTVAWLLVRGNHDARVGQLPRDWPLQVVDPGFKIERVAVGHHPGEVPQGSDIYLCGHIHPAVRVASRGDSLGKLPCFWHSRGCVVLPAIGEFTGTHVVQPSSQDDVWIVAGDVVLKHRST